MTQKGSITHLLMLAGWLAAFAAYATRLGGDADWDLRNYHLYNAFALLHGRLGFDLAPAQRQSFHAPVEDLLRYAFETLLPGTPSLRNILYTLPAAASAFLATCIAGRALPASLPHRRAIALLAAAVGATGAAGLSTLATSMSEALPTSLILGGLILALPRPSGDERPRHRFGAGLLFGIAAGLKLTTAVYTLGLLASLAVAATGSLRRRLSGAAVAGLGVGAGALVVAGPWWGYLWLRYGSPLFPYFNDIVRSPFYDPVALTDDRFKPSGLAEALAYPFLWGFTETSHVSELAFRDPRMALAVAGALLVLAHTVAACLLPRATAWRRLPPPGSAARFLAVFFLAAFAAWEAEFGVFRYLAANEAICGIVMLLPLAALAQDRPLRLPAATGGLLLLALIGATTAYPEWERLPNGASSLRVVFPPVPPGSTILLIQNAPLAYVATFAPPGSRFVGAGNNLIHPAQTNGLARRIEAAVRGSAGPLWSLEEINHEETGDTVLAYYDLHRTGCTKLATNLPSQPLRLCRLTGDATP